MNKFLLLTGLQLIVFSVAAQDYLSGKVTDNLGVKEIFYDRTQNDISFNVYQTVYKIVDANKKLLYSVTLTHDRTKGVLLMSVKPQNGEPTGSRISYDRAQCGLIFSDKGTLDTTFSSKYNYLFSFTDTLRTHPVIHQFKTFDKANLVLDPLSKLRIRKHNEIVRNIITPELQNAFNQQLFNLRDSLYAKQFRLNEMVNDIRKQIERDVSVLMEDKQVEEDVKRYEGEKRFGNPHGKGLLVFNGNIYDGNFKEGKFVSGNVMLRSNEEEYCGQYTSNNKNGTGWLKFTNSSYLLGIFTNNELTNGVALRKNADGEIYFGSYNGRRNGYGELQNNTGGKYAGEFLEDRLIKGYAKEIDPFGYYTYSRIESGNKISIDAKTAEDFFGLSLSADKNEEK